VFPQPESTIDANQFTKPEFTAQSNRLLRPEVTHAQAEVSHMNARFGKEFLLSLLTHLSNTDDRASQMRSTKLV
jgi:hypothetical protein